MNLQVVTVAVRTQQEITIAEAYAAYNIDPTREPKNAERMRFVDGMAARIIQFDLKLSLAEIANLLNRTAPEIETLIKRADYAIENTVDTFDKMQMIRDRVFDIMDTAESLHTVFETMALPAFSHSAAATNITNQDTPMADLVTNVSLALKVPEADIMGDKRQRHILQAKYIAIAVAKAMYPNREHTDIGAFFSLTAPQVIHARENVSCAVWRELKTKHENRLSQKVKIVCSALGVNLQDLLIRKKRP